MKMEQKFTNKSIIIAPHLDDEIIGCYEYLKEIDYVIYFTKDYRIEHINNLVKSGGHEFNFEYIHIDDAAPGDIQNCILYLPSKFDHHPYHHTVRKAIVRNISGNNIFRYYNIEMNSPFLEECSNPEDKLRLLKKYYPGEKLFINDEKYWLFNCVVGDENIVYNTFYPLDKTIKVSVPNILNKRDVMNVFTQYSDATLTQLVEKINSLLPNKLYCKLEER